MVGTSLLDVARLHVRFGPVTAVDGIRMTVAQGSLVGLIGPNGAGKTTALDALSGFVPASGAATFDGRPLLRMPAHARARNGLVRTWQSLELFDSLSVRENLLVSAARSGRGKEKTGDVVARVAGELGLDESLDRFPEELSQGQQKILGLARGLVARPRMLMADEPAAGLDTQESRALGKRLQALRDDGLTILLVDHDMGLVLGICDYIYVLEHGGLIAEGTPAEIRTSQVVIDSYLGGSGEPA